MEEVPQKKRTRKRSTEIQIQELLNISNALDKEPTNDLTVSRMKFLQARLLVLSKMQTRERHRKLEKILAENERLTAENEQLKAAALAKPAVRQQSAVEQVLANYAVERRQSASHEVQNGGQ